MASAREYGAAIFSPGLGEVLLIKHSEESGWAFPFAHTTESDIHVVAAASAVRQLLGVDVGDKISRTHWIEAEFPQTGALVRLYVALGVRPEAAVPRCANPSAVAQWHPLRSIFPPVNTILRADRATAGATTATAAAAAAADADEDEEDGGSLVLETGIAPFLAKLKALLNRHPEWRISQLDPNLARLIQEALTLPAPTTHQPQHPHQPPQQQQPEQQQQQDVGSSHRQQSDSGDQERHLQQQPHGRDLGAGQQQQQEEAEGVAEQALQERAAPRQEDLETTAEQQQQQQLEEQTQQLEKQQPETQPGAAAGGEGPAAAAAGGQAADDAAGSGDTAGGSAGEAGQAAPKKAAAAVISANAAGTGGAGAASGGSGGEGEGGDDGGGTGGGWRGPQPQEHLLEYCRLNDLPEPCYSLVVKKSARRPLVTASCILSHLGVQVTPDMHVPGGIHAACQAAALAAILWLEGALPPDGGEAVRVVPVGWPPLLSEARGEAWEAAQMARRAGEARREQDTAQREALLREMDKKRQRLVAEAAELERLMEALRGGGGFPEPDLSRLTASLGLGGNGGGAGEGPSGAGASGGAAGQPPAAAGALVLATQAQTPASGGARGAKRGAAGGDAGDGSGGLSGLATGLRALKFRSGSDNLGSVSTPGGGGGGGGRAPGTKRPREDGQAMAGQGGEAGGSGAGATPTKNVVMELKELCDRKRWPQPQYAFRPGAGPGAAAVVTLPPAAGLGEVSSGPQSNRKRAKEAAAAAALAQLSALGLK